MRCVLLLVLAAGCSPAARQLHIDLSPKTLRYLQSARIEIQGKSERIAIDQLQLQDGLFTWSLAAGGEGMAAVQMRYEAARARMLDREDGTEWRVDTTRPMAPDLDEADRVGERIMRGLIGKGYSYRVDRRGQIADLQSDGMAFGEVRDFLGPLPERPVAEGGTWTWQGTENMGVLKDVPVDMTGRVGGRAVVHGVACTELHFERRFGTPKDSTFKIEQKPDVGVLCLSDDGRPLRQQFTFEKITRDAGFPVTAKGTISTVWVPADAPVPWSITAPDPAPAPPAAPISAGRDRLGDPLPPGALVRLGTDRAGQGREIKALVAAPTGHAVARVSLHHLDIIDGATGRLLRTLETPCTPIKGVAWRADGQQLAVACSNRFDEKLPPVMIFDGDATAPSRTFDEPARALAIGYAGDTLLIAGHHGSLWRVAKGKPTEQMLDAEAAKLPKGDDEAFYALSAAPNGRAIVYGRRASWLVEPGGAAKTITFPGDEPLVRLGPWLPKRTDRLALALDNQIGVFDVNAMRWIAHEALPVDGSDGPEIVTLSADGSLLGGWSAEVNLRLWEIRGETLHALPAPKDHGQSLGMTADGRYLLSLGPGESLLRIFDRQTNTTAPLGDGHRGLVEQAAVAPDASQVALVDGVGAVRLWAMKDGAPGQRWQLPKDLLGHHMMNVGWTRDGRVLAVGPRGGALLTMDGAVTPQPHVRGSHFVTTEHPGVAALIHEKSIEGWRLGAQLERRWQVPSFKTREPCDLRLSDDGSTALVVYDRPDRAELRDMKTGETIRHWKTDDCVAAVSGDGTRVAVVGSSSNQVLVFDVKSGAQITRVVHPKTALLFGFNDLALDATGRRLAILHRGRVSLYDLAALKAPELEGGPVPPNRAIDVPGRYFTSPRFIGDRLLVEPHPAASVLIFDARL